MKPVYDSNDAGRVRRAWNARLTCVLEPRLMRQMTWLLISMILIASAHAGKVKMKEVKYRGGIITFTIPSHWVEEYEPDGGGMFYEDAQDTGTLRLNIITAKSPQPLSADVAFEELVAMKNVKAESVQRLENGNAIATSIQHSSEQGEAITLFWWHVTNPVRPNHLRIANFSYTVLTSHENSETTKRKVQLISESIKNAKFHPTLGQ